MHSTACPDWAERLKSGQSIIPPPIFPESAEMALSVFKQLKIVDAPGSPTFGEVSAPWVFDLVAAIFGSYNPETGERLIKEVFLLISKKNGKSTLAAGIMMTALILNWRQSAGFTILAPTVEIASNAFNPSRDMAKRDEALNQFLKVQTHIRTITHAESEATLKVLAANSESVSGIKSVGTLIDELWLFGKQASAENMLREALGGLASRPEGFVIYTTTQSDEAPAGVFKQKLEYARDVRDGKIHDPAFLPILFEHPPEMIKSGEHLKLENMHLTNPNLGYSVDWKFLEREYMKAQSAGTASLLGYMSKHANVEMSVVLRSDGWPGAEFWQQQAVPAFDLDELIKRSEVVAVGIDGGGLDDLLAISVIGREAKTRKWLAWSYAWAHTSVLERRKNIVSRLQDFAAVGELTIVERVGQDVEELAEIVKRIDKAGILCNIGIDPAGIGGIIAAIEEVGVNSEKIVAISQGWKLHGAIKTAERKLAERTIIHPGQGLMAWAVGNAKQEPRGNAVIITKQASGSAKIDPLMAFLNAVSIQMTNPAKMKKEFLIMNI